MRNRFGFSLILAGALIAPVALHSQDAGAGAGAQAITDAQVASVDAGARAQVRALAESARRAGLPYEHILDVARKGTLRRQSAALIVTAAERSMADLVTARTHLGATAEAEDLKAGASLLRERVSPGVLERIRDEKTGEPLFVAFGTILDLANQQVPMDSAVLIVARMTIVGVRNADIAEFRTAVQNDIRLGALPAAAATTRFEATIQSRATRPLDRLRTNPLGVPTMTDRPPPLAPIKP